MPGAFESPQTGTIRPNRAFGGSGRVQRVRFRPLGVLGVVVRGFRHHGSEEGWRDDQPGGKIDGKTGAPALESRGLAGDGGDDGMVGGFARQGQG